MPRPRTSHPYHSPVWDQAAKDADLTLTLPGDVPMFFRRIPAGDFLMGSRGKYRDEEPIHRVVMPEDFYLATFVVTQAQYRAVAERCPGLRESPDPSHFKGDLRPVEQVSWRDATAFCEWLSAWEGLREAICVRPGVREEIAGVRLPTEAQWEYACRGRSETEYYNGEGAAALVRVGWYQENSGDTTHPVDERPEAHPWGLHGMHGNVRDWCWDVYDPKAYRKRLDGWEAREWTLADAGNDAEYWEDEVRKTGRVLRGGSWLDSAWNCRSGNRFRDSSGDRYGNIGFRVCLVRGPADGAGPAGAGTETTELVRSPDAWPAGAAGRRKHGRPQNP